LIDVRRQCSAFSDGDMTVIDTGNDRLFGFVRAFDHERVGVIANFSEQPQPLATYHVRQQGFTGQCVDLLTGTSVVLDHELILEPYQLLCLSVTQ
jgi:amylosucrase